MRRLTFLMPALLLLVAGGLFPISAQAQCGTADRVQMPLDTNTYHLVQDFGAQSGRHQGRYHTGEDWTLPDGAAYGQPVYAIADGRVTFSSPNGWGRDGGVIIVEHAFPDGTTFYSMYGHLTDATGVEFPAEYSCVRAGDILASIGDVRPAPHLHFEIRAADAVWGSAIPGQGYSWQAPERLGLRRPGKFVVNWAAWLNDAFRWRVDLADEAGAVAPPVTMDDLSLVVIDNNRVIRVSPDGRILWRVALDERAVGLLPLTDGAARVVYTSGRVQNVARDGTLGGEAQFASALDGPPMNAFGLLLFHTPDDALVALDQTGGVAWRIETVAPVETWAATATTFAAVTLDTSGDRELLTIARDGTLLDRAYLREAASVVAAPDGTLRAYTAGGLWQISDAGVWTERLQTNGMAYPNGSAPRALWVGVGGETYLFAGGTLYAYAADGQPLWQAQTNLQPTGDARLQLIEGVLALTSDDGYLAAYNPETSAPCATLRIWGDWRADAYTQFDTDGIFRFYTADQVVGLDWDEFTQDCR